MSYRFLFMVVGILGFFGVSFIGPLIGTYIPQGHWSLFGLTIVGFSAMVASVWILICITVNVESFDRWIAETFPGKERNSQDANE